MIQRWTGRSGARGALIHQATPAGQKNGFHRQAVDPSVFFAVRRLSLRTPLRGACRLLPVWSSLIQTDQGTGSGWLPKTGSKVAHRNLTAAVLDSRDFISAKQRTENETHCPPGTRIAFTGGDFEDHALIFKTLDQTREKYPDMILFHGGTPSGAELIAAKWAENRKVTQVAFRPDWKSHNKAAPFKRNDELLKVMPKGIIAAPGTGIHDNLVDKAKRLGIPVLRIGPSRAR